MVISSPWIDAFQRWWTITSWMGRLYNRKQPVLPNWWFRSFSFANCFSKSTLNASKIERFPIETNYQKCFLSPSFFRWLLFSRYLVLLIYFVILLMLLLLLVTTWQLLLVPLSYYLVYYAHRLKRRANSTYHFDSLVLNSKTNSSLLAAVTKVA